MGRSYTPTHAIEVMVDGSFWTPSGWRKEYGRPTAENLTKHVKAIEASTLPGGPNSHLGTTIIRAARIVTNRGEKKLVAGYARQRTFQTINWMVRGVSDPAGIDIAFEA